MNREILFRGRLNNSTWAYGNLRITKDGTYIITPDDTPTGKYGRVDPETVGQYTGICDKCGKGIFEGDILEVDNDRFVITWDKEDAKFVATCIFENCVYDLGDFYPDDINIVGNIHDSLELGR